MTRRQAGVPRRTPLVVVVIVALVPALGLGGLWRWADAVADEPVETIPTADPTGPPAPELTTTIASLRRVPAPLAVESAEREFEQSVADTISAAVGSVDGTSCAVVALDGVPVAEVDPGTPILPASNQKLLVASVALDLLGDDRRFVTEVRGAAIVDGVVAGDLFVVGGGDPALTSDEVDEAVTPRLGVRTRFDDLVEQLVDAGVTRIEGNLVADGSRYDDEFLVPSWGADITRGDGGPMGALLVNGGRIVGSGIGLNPAQSAANELNRLLVARGVVVAGGNRVGAAPAEGVEVLASIESAPLGEIVDAMLLVSHNTTAEMLLKEIGFVATGEGSRPAGMATVRERLAAWEVPLDGASLEDASGLSRDNAVSCTTFAQLLDRVGPDSRLADGLPVAGESGTLADQLVGTDAVGVLRAKTGTLTGAKALSGFVSSDAGTVFEFSVLLEGEGVEAPDVYEPVWLAVVDAVADHPVVPDVARFSPR